MTIDRTPVHRDRDEFREEPRGEQRVADGWDFLGGLALLVPLFGGAYALDVWIRRWPEVAPFIAVLGAVACLLTSGLWLRKVLRLRGHRVPDPRRHRAGVADLEGSR